MVALEYWLSAAVPPAVAFLSGAGAGAGVSALGAASGAVIAGGLPPAWRARAATAALPSLLLAVWSSGASPPPAASLGGAWALWALCAESWLLGADGARVGARLSPSERVFFSGAAAAALAVATAVCAAAARGAPPAGADAVAALLCGGSALVAIAAAPLVARRAKSGATVCWAAVAAAAAEYAALYAVVLREEPLAWLARLVAANAGAAAWLAAVLGAALAVLARGAGAAARGGATTRGRAGSVAAPPRLVLLRKSFHVLALALFAPPVVLAAPAPGGLAFLRVACAGALHVALAAEALRASLPPRAALRAALDAALRPFCDGRDAEPLLLTHLFLIAGCAVPVLLPAAGGAGGALLLPLAGVLAAVGDGAAAAAGVYAASRGAALTWARALALCGVPQPPPARAGALAATLARKTVQGTAAFAAAAAATAAAVLGAAPAGADLTPALAAAAGCAAAAALLETVIVGVDNLVLPFAFWLLLRVALPS
jgi:dolichol kinase